MNKEIIFVYNANSSFFSQVTDFAHKAISPDTYECNLCKLTYEGLGMKKVWKEFIKSLPMKATFLHKNDFIKMHPDFSKHSFPAIFQADGKIVREIVSAEKINQQNDIEDLKNLISRAI